MMRRLQLLLDRRDPADRGVLDRAGVPLLPRLPRDPRDRRVVHRDPPRPVGPRGGLRGQPAERPRRRPDPGHLHAPQHEPHPEALARGPQPDDAAGRPARPGDPARLAGRAVVARPGPARPARPLPDRAAPDPDRRPVRLLRGIGDGRPGRRRRRVPADRADPAVAPAGRERRRHEPRRPERTLQTTPLATTVRPWAPGDSFNRIHWRATARHGEIQVKEFELEQTADAWIFLDLDRSVQAGRGDESTVEVAVRVAASIADKAILENRAVGMTVNGHRTAILPADRGSRQHLKIMQLLAAVDGDGSTPLVETLVDDGRPAAPGHDRDPDHAPRPTRPGSGRSPRSGRAGSATVVVTLDAAAFDRVARAERERAGEVVPPLGPGRRGAAGPAGPGPPPRARRSTS